MFVSWACNSVKWLLKDQGTMCYNKVRLLYGALANVRQILYGR